MEEIILQTLIKMRTDYGNNEMIIFAQDSDLKVVADEIIAAINDTHCCETFYCQSHIEDNGICNTQCDHCKEYYRPLEQRTTQIKQNDSIRFFKK